MTCRRAAAALCLSLVAAARAAGQSEQLVVPVFGQVSIYADAAAPRRVVLLLSGEDGFSSDDAHVGEELAGMDTLVVGVDTPRFARALAARKRCAYPAGDLEELSRTIQLRRGLPAYRRPVLVGLGAGAALGYAALVAAPPETFAGGIGLGFCPRLQLAVSPCAMRGLAAIRSTRGPWFELAPAANLAVPWVVIRSDADTACDAAAVRAFVPPGTASRVVTIDNAPATVVGGAGWLAALETAYRSIVAESSAPPPLPSVPAVADLQPIEVPAAPRPPAGDTMAVFVSGDGGWAEIDKAVAAGLAARGIPVVGLSSLTYFWTPRTPDEAARDLARLIEHYGAAWNRPRVLLAGYSFGADVLPFLVTRLPEEMRRRVTRVGLLGLSETASFEFHLSSWVGGGSDPAYRTVPEIRRMDVPVTCVAGADESDSVCPEVSGVGVRTVVVGRGHHFGGEYARLVDALLQ